MIFGFSDWQTETGTNVLPTPVVFATIIKSPRESRGYAKERLTLRKGTFVSGLSPNEVNKKARIDPRAQGWRRSTEVRLAMAGTRRENQRIVCPFEHYYRMLPAKRKVFLLAGNTRYLYPILYVQPTSISGLKSTTSHIRSGLTSEATFSHRG